ncbi:ribonuclease T(2) [Stakelama sediminis]|uniref:Ribonuclease T2 n=1 Tax=Stakelama sediminis TaxID=463200 RepID=A0A840YVA8_9SPHN|nr:ribonuclease T [Stakelama sediminis]MBB5717500.1 ribonuclease T2 [Stakelama sediminis]
MKVTFGLAAALTAAILPQAASAQAYSCKIPQTLPVPEPALPSPRQPRRIMPVGGYTLALIWAPQSCHERAGDGFSGFMCGSENSFGFTLHGLWPDGQGKSWPQYCRSTAILPPRVVRRNLCATPSANLLQHEYAKHGTCMGISPQAYFKRSTGLYAKLRYPNMQALSHRRTLTVGQFAAAFAQANPGISPDMLKVRTNRKGWLEEVWLCLDTRFRYKRCKEAGAPATARVKIWRGAR